MKPFNSKDISITPVAWASGFYNLYKTVHTASIKKPPGGETKFPGGFISAPSGNSLLYATPEG